MRPFKELCNDQIGIHNELIKILENIRKEGSRRTADYIHKKQKIIDDYWESFQATDDNIRSHDDLVTSCEYLQEDVFQKTEELHAKITTKLKEYLLITQQPGKQTDLTPTPQENKADERPGTHIDEQAIRFKRLSIKLKTINKTVSSITGAIQQSQGKAFYAQKRKNLEDMWNNFANLHEEVETYASPEDYDHDYFQNDTFDETEKKVQETILTLTEKEENANIRQNEDTVRLPRVTIPYFEGNYSTWTTFYDLFVRIIHNNQKISNVEKMQYLKTHLKGDAQILIQHLDITDVNYNTAWQMLIDRYNNKRILLTTHLDKFLNQTPLLQESAAGIKQLHDITNETMHAIKNLGVDIQNWDPIAVHILIKKLDKETNKLYEQTLTTPKNIQKLNDLLKFLETRFQSLEAIGQSTKRIETQPNQNQHKKYAKISSNHAKTSHECLICKGQHLIYACKIFQEWNQKERYEHIKKNKLCYNCLNHSMDQKCYSERRCLKCDRPHHTLLHFDSKSESKVVNNKNTTASHVTMAEQANKESTVITHVAGQAKNILLATALVKAKNAYGTFEYLRALIDPGSQASFITEQAAQILAIPKVRICTEISGLGSTDAGVAKAKLHLELCPRFPAKLQIQGEFLIMPKLTKTLPNNEITTIDLSEWQNYMLADPTLTIPGPIDLLIGADIYAAIVLNELKTIRQGLIAQNTKLGWIIMGETEKSDPNPIQIVSMVSCIDLEKHLLKFWEIEEVSAERTMSVEQAECEAHYSETHSRNQDGTYTVKIPFKDDTQKLGDSKKRAIARQLQLEKRFQQDKKLERQYAEFINEYINLGHMCPITEEDANKTEKIYYMPHQAVVKEDSSTTKLRVVFDASAKSSSGISLNQMMHTGPRLQQDLADILLRWRKHKISFTADIEKMYRQIRIEREDQNYQRIVWRPSKNESIQEYKLTTVTYGTASAPYLAVRTLQQLAIDEQHNFRNASKIALKDFYVDDLLSGADTIEKAKKLQLDLIDLLKSGGFNLRKWKANHPELIQNIPEQMREPGLIEINEEKTVKTLGIHWLPTNDNFKFIVKLSTDTECRTKRAILSDIAKLYDPLGWLAPIMVRAKILMQELWLDKQDWDQPISQELWSKWMKFKNELPMVETINIPRWIQYTNENDIVELHGFCDASEKAYGAVIYSRIRNINGEIKICLLTSKSKVAPIKTKKSLPRLELCAAVLLANLIIKAKTALELQNISIYTWSDSMIALAWIQGNSDRWNTFVANRVSEIQSLVGSKCWRHVSSEDNPADAVSRGVTPEKLTNLWWLGPKWLSENNKKWLPSSTDFQTNEETKKSVNTTVMTTSTGNNEIFLRFSTLTKLLRVTSYCKRFINLTKIKYPKEVSTIELHNTLQYILLTVQQKSFPREIRSLNTNTNIDPKSKLLSLNPFLDANGTLRVGGRIQNSLLNYEERHPIILPYDDHVTRLIILNAHQTTLHGGNKITAAFLRRKYWILNGRNTIRKLINKCVKCSRLKAKTNQQLMGTLPSPRVTPSKPFTHTGIDFAGPINIRTAKGRGNKSYKGYISVFVCLATKAIHIEVVSDMTTNTFIAAFKRFLARRGECAHVYSDNGTTFVGAKKILDKEFHLVLQDNNIINELAMKGTQWHFIPPAAPHFGGIWEAGVKSIKYHLKRVVGDSCLTYEELTTVLYQVEACLNSRPLCAMTSDPFDYTPLTPGHFLVGQSLINPTFVMDDLPESKLLTRWKLVQKINKDFWTAWKSEYLTRLQQRPKWQQPSRNVEVGELVLIKDDNVSALKWPLARITEVHSGDDGKIRVVTLRSKNQSTLKRPITKICQLPINDQPSATNEVGRTETSNDSSTQSTTSTVIRGSSISNLIIICLMLFGILQSSNASFIIKHPEPGLYVEQVGHAQLKRGVLRVELSYTYKEIKENNKNAIEMIGQFIDLCYKINRLSADTHCIDMITHLEEKHGRIQSHINILLEGTSNSRNSRGLLGDLLQKIFGVNDEVFTDIDRLSQNQQKLIKTADHQSTLMLTTLSKVEEINSKTTEKLNQVIKKLNKGLETINEMQMWYSKIDSNRLNIQVLAIYQVSANYLDDLDLKYEKIIDALLKKGNILEFLSASMAFNITKTAQQKIPPHLDILPVPMNKLDLTSTSEEIKIHGYFHIAEVTKYQIVQITPIPKKMKDNNFLILDVPPSLMAINYDKQVYFLITKKELGNSVRLGKNTFLCTPAVVNNIENKHNCIIDEIYDRPDRRQCSLHQLVIKTLVWKQLYMVNTWLFIANSPVPAAINCNGVRNDVLLTATGIIKIDPECTIQTKKTTLKSTIQEESPIISTFNKKANIMSNFSIPKHRIHHFEPEAVLESSQQVIQQQREAELDLQYHLDNTPWEIIRHHAIGIGTSTIATLIILGTTLFLWKFRTTARPTYSPPGEYVETTV